MLSHSRCVFLKIEARACVHVSARSLNKKKIIGIALIITWQHNWQPAMKNTVGIDENHSWRRYSNLHINWPFLLTCVVHRLHDNSQQFQAISFSALLRINETNKRIPNMHIIRTMCKKTHWFILIFILIIFCVLLSVMFLYCSSRHHRVTKLCWRGKFSWTFFGLFTRRSLSPDMPVFWMLLPCPQMNRLRLDFGWWR